MVNMNVRTCYDILNVSREATLDEAKEAYKRLVKLWHPDQYGNFPEKQELAQEKLKEINVAYRDVVSILKNRPDEPESPAVKEDEQRHHENNPENNKRNGTSLLSIVSHFINTNILGFIRSKGPKQNSRLSPGIPRDHDHGAASTSGGGGIAPDFQQIFKRTVQEKRFVGDTRKRHMKRKRIRGQFGNPASYRANPNTRRRPGNRVEKITPVRRVNRIGN